jgi:hypothetical protein
MTEQPGPYIWNMKIGTGQPGNGILDWSARTVRRGELGTSMHGAWLLGLYRRDGTAKENVRDRAARAGRRGQDGRTGRKDRTEEKDGQNIIARTEQLE